MDELSLDVKISCQNSILKNPPKEPTAGGALWRGWKIKLLAVEGTRELKGLLSELLDHVEYILHPTFENPRRVVTKEPYVLKEKGWGEFDMRIVMHFRNNIANTEVMLFDLNFSQPSYTTIHTVYFPDPSPELVQILERSSRLSQRKSAPIDDRLKEDASPSSPFELSEFSRKDQIVASPINYRSPKEESLDYGAASPYSSSSPIPSYGSPNNGGVVYSPNDYVQDIDSLATIEEIKYEFKKFWDRPIKYSATQAEAIQQDKMKKRESTMTELGRRLAEEEEERQAKRLKLEKLRRPITDKVYCEQDVDNVDPIHGSEIDPKLKEAWGIPLEVNMLELARRLSRMDDDQKRRFRAIMLEHKSDDMTIKVNDKGMVFDLYSLGPVLLTRLWEFVHEDTQNTHQYTTP